MATSPATWREALRPNTRAIYVEAMSNPLLQVSDLQAAVDFAAENGLVSIIDNTFASPINFRPAEIGFDLSLHSGTKYLNGHTDIVAGAVIGRAELVERITHTLNHLGGSLDPHACFLLHRGMKTLAVRVRHQNESALKIARWLEQHRAVARVNYPGLESHSNHLRACELFDGFGGVLSFELEGGLDAAQRFMDRVTIPISAPSLGGVETPDHAAGDDFAFGNVGGGARAGGNRRRTDPAVGRPGIERRPDRGFRDGAGRLSDSDSGQRILGHSSRQHRNSTTEANVRPR